MVWGVLPNCPTYEVSDDGRVRNANTKKELAQSLNTTGTHLRVCLWCNNKAWTVEVHRLVLTTFIGPKPSNMEGRHLNGNAMDNSLGNLQYGTRQDNADDRVKHGNSPRGERGGLARLTKEQVKEIRLRYKRYSHKRSNVKELAEEFGVNRSHILRLINYVQWVDD